MPASIFSGTRVKILKDIFGLGSDNSTAPSLHNSTTNPTSSAVDAEPGSLLLNRSSGVIYRKTDSGSSTNWVALAGAFGVQNETGTFTADIDNVHTIDTSGGALTANLPTASGLTGQTIILKKTTSDLDVVTVDGSGSETIDGDTTTTINTEGETLIIVSDGTNWEIVDRHIPQIMNTFTPTGGWSTNTTYSGQWYRESGLYAHVRMRVTTSGAPNAATLTINLPFTIDTSLLESANDQTVFESEVKVLDSGTAQFIANVRYSTTTAIVLSMHGATATYVNEPGVITNTFPFTFASGDAINMVFRVPVSGWKG